MSADADDGSDRWGELGAFIREQRRLTHLSLRKLAELAEVSNPYLSQIERGLRKPSAEILQQIARALSISAESLYIRAGILDDRSHTVDVVGEIRRDPTLTSDQRQALITIYQSFQADRAGTDRPGSDGAGSDGVGAGALLAGDTSDTDSSAAESSDPAGR